ncbi:MAG: ribosome biogenesis GTPase Der [Spirochaetaceae bacterium]|jgi:GTP-binding protein|nr:ribosome biogenesis GTPase Der [Spirochaetaceae bacterium]
MESANTTAFENLPLVVIAGRPNVGKSTLFNRLLGRRRAITDPCAGLTRDPVSEDAFVLGKPLRLVDTGGFKLDRPEDADAAWLDDVVVDRALAALERADLVILVLEAGALTGEDEEFIETLRPLRDKLLVAVNKTEGGRLTPEAWNLTRYGFSSLCMISAEHGDNIENLKAAIVEKLDFSAVRPAAGGVEEAVRITLVGKPNTGKSTLSNRLTASAASIVSPVAGTTRDVLEGSFLWRGRRFLVCDTAGIRRKARVSGNIEYYSVNRAIKTMDSASIVIILIDAAEGLSDQDKKIAALAEERGRGVVFALNKWDTMGDVKNTFNAVLDKFRYFFGQMSWAPVLPVSALTGAGVDALLSTCVKMAAQLNLHTSTSALNAALEVWQKENPPPAGPRTRFRIKYGVQTSCNPVVFRLFASRPHSCTEAYLAYLRRKIRAGLGYPMIPVKIEICRSGREERPEGRRSGGRA